MRYLIIIVFVRYCERNGENRPVSNVYNKWHQSFSRNQPMEGMLDLGKKEKINRLKSHALADLRLVEMEYKQILKKTSGEPETYNWKDLINDTDLKGLYKVRKDRKYASLTVELYAIIEQLLKDIYDAIYDNAYVQTPEVNVILDLEKKMSRHLHFDNNTKLLADLRSHIVHEDFSLKKARKDEKINITLSNKNLFKRLLQDVEGYIKNIEVK